MADPEIRVRSWVRASDEETATGLLGFLSIYLGNLVIDGVVLRKTASGRLALSFPARTSRSGQRYAIVRPLDDQARREIEREIFGQLGQREDLGAATEGDHE